MKKIWLALAGMVLAFSASAAQFEDGKQYSIAHIATSLKKSFMFLRT